VLTRKIGAGGGVEVASSGHVLGKRRESPPIGKMTSAPVRGGLSEHKFTSASLGEVYADVRISINMQELRRLDERPKRQDCA